MSNTYISVKNCVFDSKPILFEFATRSRGNRKICSLPSTYKAEARFRVKKNSGVSLTLNRSFLNLQREAEATGKFVLCLQLTKLKLGLELKQKITSKPQITNNSNPTHLKCLQREVDITGKVFHYLILSKLKFG